MCAYPGGGADLVRRGVISGGRLLGSKARILLMVTLGATQNIQRVRQIFENNS